MPHTEPPPQPPELDTRRISGRLVVLIGIVTAVLALLFTYLVRPPQGDLGDDAGSGGGTGAVEAREADGS